MSVRIERDGPVATIVLARPSVKNAVDRPTADALADAFRIFEGDHDALVAVLYGEGGTFCAGADLKAIGTERQSRVEFALELAAFPQSCLNVDRLSAIQGGVAALQAEGVAGAARFAGGAGRHGDFGR